MIWMTREGENGWAILVLVDEDFNLKTLPKRLREVLENPDFESELGQALFPQGYRKDPLAEAEYQSLMREDILKGKLDCLIRFEKNVAGADSIHAESDEVEILHISLTDEDLALWLGFLHDMRILIGTNLKIEDDNWNQDIDPSSPHFDEIVLMERIAELEGAIIRALRESDGMGAPKELDIKKVLEGLTDGEDLPFLKEISEEYDLSDQDEENEKEDDEDNDSFFFSTFDDEDFEDDIHDADVEDEQHDSDEDPPK